MRSRYLLLAITVTYVAVLGFWVYCQTSGIISPTEPASGLLLVCMPILSIFAAMVCQFPSKENVRVFDWPYYVLALLGGFLALQATSETNTFSAVQLSAKRAEEAAAKFASYCNVQEIRSLARKYSEGRYFLQDCDRLQRFGDRRYANDGREFTGTFDPAFSGDVPEKFQYDYPVFPTIYDFWSDLNIYQPQTVDYRSPRHYNYYNRDWKSRQFLALLPNSIGPISARHFDYTIHTWRSDLRDALYNLASSMEESWDNKVGEKDGRFLRLVSFWPLLLAVAFSFKFFKLARESL